MKTNVKKKMDQKQKVNYQKGKNQQEEKPQTSWQR